MFHSCKFCSEKKQLKIHPRRGFLYSLKLLRASYNVTAGPLCRYWATRRIRTQNYRQYSALQELVCAYVLHGTGIANISCKKQKPGLPRVEEQGGIIMMKILNYLKARLSSFRSANRENSNRQETLAMVYVGDIYAVLVRDRAVRQLALTERRRMDHRHEAGWPFIR